MGNRPSRSKRFQYRPHRSSSYYLDNPPWSAPIKGRSKSAGHMLHPAVRPPMSHEDEHEYYPDEVDYDYSHHQSSVRSRRQHPFPEPEFSEGYHYDSLPFVQPAHIPFPPVHEGYGPPVIPNLPRRPHGRDTHGRGSHGRSHTYPVPGPSMPVPVVMPAPHPSQPQSSQPPVIPPVIPVIPHRSAPTINPNTVPTTNIPYPTPSAPIFPPGQPVIYAPPPNMPVAGGTGGGAGGGGANQPVVPMPEPDPQPPPGPSSQGRGRATPGLFGPSGEAGPSRRTPEHRRARSHNQHGQDDDDDDPYYQRRRHRYSVDHQHQRRRESLKNPLPSPPKDLFEQPELAELLTQMKLPPEVSTLKRDPHAPTHALIIPPIGGARIERVHTLPVHHTSPPHHHEHPRHASSSAAHDRDRTVGSSSSGEKEKKKGGLFRSLSHKLKPKTRGQGYYADEGGIPIRDLVSPQPVIVLTAQEQMLPPPVPSIFPPPPALSSDTGQSDSGVVPPPGQYGHLGGDGGDAMPALPPRSPTLPTLPRPNGTTSHSTMPIPANMPIPHPSASPIPPPPGPSTHPPPPTRPPTRPTVRSPSPPPPLKIDRQNYLSPLLHFSHHPVHFQDRVYPTAYHLYEALKFMSGPRPDVAEMIRTCGGGLEGTRRAGEISREFREYARVDFEVMVRLMEEALYHKFVQHVEARGILLATRVSRLLFSDPEDNFWGDGSDGQGRNEIGRILERIRDKLRAAGYA